MVSFLDVYRDYNKLTAKSYGNYADILGCSVLGHAMGRGCRHLIQPDYVYHNMYSALVGPSTITRKSTSQRMAMEIYPESKCHPNDCSPEQFISELAQHPQFYQWYGEFSYMLKGIRGHGYMSTMAEIMNDIYDCPPKRVRTIKKNNTTYLIEYPYLSFTATCTPEMMQQTLDIEKAKGGFLARFLLPEDDSPLISGRERLSPNAELLRKKLKRVVSIAIKTRGITDFEFTDQALDRYNKIQDDLLKKTKILSFCGRYLDYIIKISDILLISDLLGYFLDGDWDKRVLELEKLDKLVKLVKLVKLDVYEENLKNESYRGNFSYYHNFTNLSNFAVPVCYVNEAYEIIKPSLKYVESLIEYLSVSKPIAEFEQQLNKTKNLPTTRSNILIYTNIEAKDLKNIEETLEGKNKLLIIYTQQKGRKKKTWYCKPSIKGTERCKSCSIGGNCGEKYG